MQDFCITQFHKKMKLLVSIDIVVEAILRVYWFSRKFYGCFLLQTRSIPLRNIFQQCEGSEIWFDKESGNYTYKLQLETNIESTLWFGNHGGSESFRREKADFSSSSVSGTHAVASRVGKSCGNFPSIYFFK